MMPISNFYAQMNKYRRSIVCALYMFFSAFMGLWQTNAEEQNTWAEFQHLDGIPFIVYYPKNFIVDPRSEISPSYVKYLIPEDKRLNEYYKWCMVLDSPDEAMRVRIVSYATDSCYLSYKHYKSGRDLILDDVFKVCTEIKIEEAGEYVIIQGGVTRENGQKELIIVYLGNEDDKRIVKDNSDWTYVFQKIVFTEKFSGILEKNDKIIQEIVHRFKPYYVVSHLGISRDK